LSLLTRRSLVLAPLAFLPRCAYLSRSGISPAVLDQSKLEQGKLVLAEKEICFDLLCQSCLSMLQHTKQPGVSLTVDVPTGLTIIGDHMRWHQVLVNLLRCPLVFHATQYILTPNLLSNALKFTSHGAVTLTVVPVGSSTLHVAVSDTGPGISAELAPRLFQKYAQGATSHKGSGLVRLPCLPRWRVASAACAARPAF